MHFVRASLLLLGFSVLWFFVSQGRAQEKDSDKGKAAEELAFEEVILAPKATEFVGPELYLVLAKSKGDNETDLVLKYAKAALREADKAKKAAKEDVIVVFALRKARTDKLLELSDYGVEFLQKIVEAGPKKGRELVAEHPWRSGELPKKK